MPLEYADDEFQNCMRKLQQCALKFDDMPIYIINEKVASELCYDHLKGMEEDERSIFSMMFIALLTNTTSKSNFIFIWWFRLFNIFLGG